MLSHLMNLPWNLNLCRARYFLHSYLTPFLTSLCRFLSRYFCTLSFLSVSVSNPIIFAGRAPACSHDFTLPSEATCKRKGEDSPGVRLSQCSTLWDAIRRSLPICVLPESMPLRAPMVWWTPKCISWFRSLLDPCMLLGYNSRLAWTPPARWAF